MPDHTQLMDALREVYDPCCEDRGLSVVDMGLVSDIRIDGDRASVDLILTSGWCPFMVPLVEAIRERVAALPAVGDADVRVVWDRPWTTDRLSPTARERLQFLPPPSEVPADRRGAPVPHRPTTEVPQ